MDKMGFKSYEEIAAFMTATAHDEEKDVCAIVFFEDAAKLIREILLFDDVTISFLELHDEEWNGYNKEFYVTLTSEMELFVEAAFRDGIYICPGVSLALVDGDANSKVLQSLEDADRIEIYIDDSSEEYEGNCDVCELCNALGLSQDHCLLDVLEESDYPFSIGLELV